eukprot:2502926-Prymnesium_polylepis.4
MSSHDCLVELLGSRSAGHPGALVSSRSDTVLLSPAVHFQPTEESELTLARAASRHVMKQITSAMLYS